jgi:hypothetical protein
MFDSILLCNGANKDRKSSEQVKIEHRVKAQMKKLKRKKLTAKVVAAST